MNSDQPVSRPQRGAEPAAHSPDLLLSLAAAPFLAGLVAQKVISHAVRSLGQLSEEVFRGDRLPSLSFPQPLKEPQASDQDLPE